MSKIKELLNDKESVLAFDVDGVLALMEWGEHNHFSESDDVWLKRCMEDVNPYNEEAVIERMKDFLLDKDMDRIYVITVTGSTNEYEYKKDFLNKYYNIKKENVYSVKDNMDKLGIMIEIKNHYPDLDDEKMIMIDDTVEILTDIMEKTDFSTAHISSFL